METIAVLAAKDLQELIERYEKVTERLIEAERKLAEANSDSYVPIEWICSYWNVTIDTAKDMLRLLGQGSKNRTEIRVLSYGLKLVRYRRSDIIRLTEENLVPLKDMLAQKRVIKEARKTK